MFSSIGLTICALVFLSLIAIFYFIKKKYRTLENDIFTILLIFTFALLFLEIFCVCIMSIRDNYKILNEIICRTYILGVITWIDIILIYLSTFGKDNKYRKISDILKEPFIIFSIITEVFLYTISCFLNITFTSGYNNELFVIGGSGVYVLYISFALLCGYILYILISNKTRSSILKRLPLFLFIIFLIMTTLIQLITFDFNDLTFLFTFCVISMYFTIENPDVQLMEKLEVANVEAEKVNREKTEFLSQMSHEIRTPLNSIMGFSESIMTNKNLTLEILKEDSKNINLAALNLLEIIENILDISKIESGKEKIDNIEYSVKDIIYELNSFVQSKIEKDVEFVFTIDENIPKLIKGDKVKIYKILNGLLSNSIKFTKSGKIKLDIKYSLNKDDIILKFIISDTGVGIKESDQDKLFLKFSKINQDVEVNTINSTGLGLAIVKDLVELLEGNITFESSYGVGTTFTVEIKNKIINSDRLGKVELIKHDKIELVDCSKYKVLLVDDNDISRKATYDLLSNYKFNIDIAKSGIECLEKIKTNEIYDLLIMDYMMPKMDGIETINIIKRLNDYHIPNILVVLSNNYNEEERANCLSEGFTDYLSKPLDNKSLKKLIVKYFSDSKEGEN